MSLFELTGFLYWYITAQFIGL